MNSTLCANGVRFNDCVFSDPIALAGWRPPQFAGLIAILAYDANWAPKPLAPFCFAELGNNTRQTLAPADWARLAVCAGNKPLLVSVFPMPFSTTAQRRALRNELISAYNPPCQFESPAPLESPGPEPPRVRRPIGFLPEAEPRNSPAY